MKRRTVLAGMLATPLLATAAPAMGGEQVGTRYATVVLSPHQ